MAGDIAEDYQLKFIDETEEKPTDEVDENEFVDSWGVDTARDTSLAEDVDKIGTFLDQAKETAGDIVSGYVRATVVPLEVAGTLLSGAFGMVTGGALGFGTSVAQAGKNVLGLSMTENDIRKYQPIEVISKIQEELTYKPQDEWTKAILETIAVPGEWFHEHIATTVGDIGYYSSDYVTGKIASDPNEVKSAFDSTIGATLTAATDVAAPFFVVNRLIKPALKAARSTKKAVADVRENAINEYIYNEFESIEKMLERYDAVRDLEAKIPGYKAGVVEFTESPGLAGVQRDLAGRTPARKYQLAQQTKTNRIAIKKYMDDMFDDLFKGDDVSRASMEKVLIESKGSVDAGIDYLINLNRRNLEKQTILAKGLAKADKVTLGANLRATMAQGYRLHKKIGGMLYERVGNPKINGDPFMENFIKETADPAFAQMVKARSPAIPTIYHEIMGKLKAEMENSSVLGPDGKPTKVQPIELDFTQLRDWDQQLNRSIRMLERKQDVGRELYFSRNVRNYINEAMDSLQGQGGKAAENYAVAKKFWGENVSSKFETGIVGEILRTDIKGKRGVYKVIDEAVVDTIFSKGRKTGGGKRAIDEFLAVYGDHPVAMMQLKEGVYKKLKDYADPKNTGILDPARVRGFIDENSNILNSLPEWKKDFTEINRINHGYAVTVKRTKKAQQLLENSELSKALGGDSPFALIESALKSPEAMRQLMVRVSGNKYAQAALPRAMAHTILGKAIIRDKRGVWHIDHVEARKILKNPKFEKSISMVFDKKHIDSMETIIRAWETQSPKRLIGEEKITMDINTFDKKFEQTAGTSLKSMMGDVRLIGVRHVPPQYIVGGWAIRKVAAFRRSAVEESIAKTFFDKELSMIISDVIEMEKTMRARSKQTKGQALKDIERLKIIEERLRKNMIKNGEWGFDPEIAAAQAIANIGRMEDFTSKEEKKPRLVVQ